MTEEKKISLRVYCGKDEVAFVTTSPQVWKKILDEFKDSINLTTYQEPIWNSLEEETMVKKDEIIVLPPGSDTYYILRKRKLSKY
jgi:hypothetical protein